MKKNLEERVSAPQSANKKRNELIKEIANTLWNYTKDGIHSGVEINEELDGAEVKVTIEDWPRGAMITFNDKRYRTRETTTRKKYIVEIVTMWVDEVIEQQKKKIDEDEFDA